MDVECPDLVVGVQAWQGLDSQVHDVGNFDRAAFASYVEGDRDGFHTEQGGDERGKSTQWAAGRTTEDGLKRLLLLLICSLIKVQRDRPVSFGHGSWGTCNQDNIQTIDGYVAVVATIDVEGNGDLTTSFCRLGG